MDVQAPADGDVESEVIEIQGEAETAPLRAANNPQTPSAKAMEEHRSNGHIPFRDWCKFCIKGRGLEDQHRSSAEESNILIIGLDYFFVTQPRSQTIEADDPGTQTADGPGPAHAPGQFNELEHRMRVMAHAEAVTQMPDCDVKLRSELDYDNDAAGSAKLQEALRNG